MRLVWLVCLVGCSNGGDRSKAIYCDAVVTQHQRLKVRFDSTLSTANTVVAQDRFETAAAISKRSSTCELIYVDLGGTQAAMLAFEDGARGIVESDDRSDPLTERAAILRACNAGDRAETEKLVGALRDASLQRTQQAIDACKR